MPYQLIEARTDGELIAKLTAAINSNLLPFGTVNVYAGTWYVPVATGTASAAGGAIVVTAPDSVRMATAVNVQLTAGFAPLGGTVMRGNQYVQVMTKGVPAAGSGGTITASQISDSTATGRSLITAATPAAARTTLGSGATGDALFTAATAAAARTTLGAGATGSSVFAAATPAAAQTAIGATTVGSAVLTAASTAAAASAIGIPGTQVVATDTLKYKGTTATSVLTVENLAANGDITLTAAAGQSTVNTTQTSLSIYSAAFTPLLTLNTGGVSTSGGALITGGAGGVGVRPSANNAVSCGSAAQGWTAVFAQSATITPSDERLKTPAQSLTDKILDAWATVEWVSFKFLDGGVRTHIGVIAQRVKEAFEAAGLDPFELALLCYDEWEAEEGVPDILIPGNEEYIVAGKPGYIVPGLEELKDEDGNIVQEATPDIEVPAEPDVIVPARADQLIPGVPAVTAGNRYSIRYEEALALEAALTRRELQRLRDK